MITTSFITCDPWRLIISPREHSTDPSESCSSGFVLLVSQSYTKNRSICEWTWESSQSIKLQLQETSS